MIARVDAGGRCAVCGAGDDQEHDVSRHVDEEDSEAPTVCELNGDALDLDASIQRAERAVSPVEHIELARAVRAMRAAGAPEHKLRRLAIVFRRAKLLEELDERGVPTADLPRQSGLVWDDRGLSWRQAFGDPCVGAEALFARACLILRARGYVVARRDERELWANVFEPARGAA